MLKGYRTMLLAMVIAALGAIQATDLAFIPTDFVPFVMMAIGALVAFLRKLTTGPVGDSTP